MNENWYYSTGNNDTHGPISIDELIKAAKGGILTEAGMVFHYEKTNGRWLKATDLPVTRYAMDIGTATFAGANNPPPPPIEYPYANLKEDIVNHARTSMIEMIVGLAGVIALAVGCFAILKFAMMESTRNNIYNLGLQQNRLLGFVFGIAAAMIGWVTILFFISRMPPSKNQ